jgi:hypothetical protein
MPAQRRYAYSWLLSLLVLLACSCQSIRRPFENINLTTDGGNLVSLRGAGDEWVDFVIHINGLAGISSANLQLRLVGLDRLGPDARWYHLDGKENALIPIQSAPGNAVISDLPRDGNVWIDLHIPTATPARDYHGSCQLLVDEHPIAELPLSLRVYGFSLPEHPTLTIAGEVTSAGLRRLYDGHLPDSVEPLIQLCQENRLQLWFSDLQPMNRWPSETEIWKRPNGNADNRAVIHALGLQTMLDKNCVVICKGAISGASDVEAWFYSGNEFGTPDPIQSVLLKRLRDSGQDAEYFALAERTPEAAEARALANLLVRPIVGPVDSTDSSLSSPMDAGAFIQGKEFMARMIDANHFSARQQKQWNLQLIRWIAENSRPRIKPRVTEWFWDTTKPGQIDLKLSTDIYNPSEIQPTRNTIEWSVLPAGWAIAKTVGIPSLPTDRITHAVLTGSFDATQLHITTAGASQLTFINGFDATSTDLNISIPVASCDRRTGAPVIDGSLSEWSTDDLICNAPLLSSQANPPAKILANFSDTYLFLAFRLEGIDSNDEQADCQFVMQPIFGDNSLGKLFYVNCKPNGVCQSSTSESIRYGCTVASNIWRGELAVPWKAIVSPSNAIPRALRFNVIQRNGSFGIASWAGPLNSIDPSGAISGILVLRNAPGDLVK